MCRPILLHSDTNGYITHCAGCGHVQFAFGTCLVALNEPEFDAFLEMITQRMCVHQNSSCPNKKQYSFYTDSKQVQLIFSFSDLEKLYHLLVPGKLMLQVYHL